MKYSTHERMIAKSASVINNYAVTLLMRGEFQSAARTFRDAIDIIKENHEAADKEQGVSLNHATIIMESNTTILSTSSLVSKVQAAAERVSNISKFQSMAPLGFVQAIDSDSFETLSQAASWAGSSPVVGSSVFPIFLRDHGHNDPLHPDALAAMVLYNYAIATYLTELLESQGATISSRAEETMKKNTTRGRSASYKLFQTTIGIISRVLGDPSSIQTSQDAQFSAVYILVLNNTRKALLLNRNSTIGLGEDAQQLQQEVRCIDEWITRLQLHHQLNFSFLANESNAARAA